MIGKSKVVFLSYAHADEELAMAVHRHLKAAGFEPWLDKFHLKPGSEWKPEIDKAIRHCGAFLSLISPTSIDRGGVLAGEMKLALDLRAQRLDSGGILIPVLLRPCALPSELQHLQAVNWYESDGPAKVTAALSTLLEKPTLADRFRAMARTRTSAAIAASAAVGSAILIYQNKSHGDPEAYRRFLDSRVKTAPMTEPAQIGITLWRVTEDNADGTGACGFLRFTRKPLDDPIAPGDRLRLDVQSSQAGYIYVISREVDASGAPGPANLLFPVRSVNNGNNAISRAAALLIPAASSTCETLQLTHAGEEERVSVVFSHSPLEKLAARDTPYPLDPRIDADLTASGAACTVAHSGHSPAGGNIQLPDSESRNLSYTSVGPDAVFTATQASRPAIATFSLKTAR